MTNQIVVNDNIQMPALQLDADLLQKIQSGFNTAAANTASKAFPRLSFKGREFNLTENGITTALPYKTLDVYIAAVNERFHYQFYEGEYTGKESDKDYASMSRYATPDDPFDFKPTDEWKSRLYRHRAILMIDGDPDMRLVAADFGYMSVRKKNTQGGNYMNLSDLLAHFSEFGKRFSNFLPFMIKVQLSFTRGDSVPVVQFSLVDENNPAAGIRQAPEQVVNAIAEAHAEGVIAKMLEIEYDSRNYDQSSEPVVEPSQNNSQPMTQQFQQGINQARQQGQQAFQQQTPSAQYLNQQGRPAQSMAQEAQQQFQQQQQQQPQQFQQPAQPQYFNPNQGQQAQQFQQPQQQFQQDMEQL